MGLYKNIKMTIEKKVNFRLHRILKEVHDCGHYDRFSHYINYLKKDGYNVEMYEKLLKDTLERKK